MNDDSRLVSLLTEKTAIDGNTVSITEQLSAEDYSQLKALFGKLGGKWHSSSQTHVFPTDHFKGVLAYVNEHLSIPKLNPHQLFPTPSGIIDEMLSVDPIAGMLQMVRDGVYEGMGRSFEILEPSAGTGAIASRLRDETEGKANVDIYEIDPVNQAILKGQGFELTGEDFLTAPDTKKYDLIVMNPPFAGRTYIKHVMHAYSMLKPTGVIVSVLPSIRADRSNPLFRLIARHGSAWENPQKSFKEAGTTVDTLCAIIEPACEFEPYSGYSSRDEAELDLTISNDQVEYEAYMNFVSEQAARGPLTDMFGDLLPGAKEAFTKYLNAFCDRVASLESCIVLSDQDVESYAKSSIARALEVAA